MSTFLLILFILAAVVLVFSVLLQTGKGGLGEVFGGGGERALFGGKGAGGFIAKLTIGAAVVFMVTAMILSIVTSRRGRIRRPVPVVPSAPVEVPGSAAEGTTP